MVGYYPTHVDTARERRRLGVKSYLSLAEQPFAQFLIAPDAAR
jgi:hypothetical protein